MMYLFYGFPTSNINYSCFYYHMLPRGCQCQRLNNAFGKYNNQAVTCLNISENAFTNRLQKRLLCINVTLKSQSILLHTLILFSLFAQIIIFYMPYTHMIWNSKSINGSPIILLNIQLTLGNVTFWYLSFYMFDRKKSIQPLFLKFMAHLI